MPAISVRTLLRNKKSGKLHVIWIELSPRELEQFKARRKEEISRMDCFELVNIKTSLEIQEDARNLLED